MVRMRRSREEMKESAGLDWRSLRLVKGAQKEEEHLKIPFCTFMRRRGEKCERNHTLYLGR